MAAAARIRFSTLLPPIPGLFVNLPEAFAQAPRATAQGPPQQHAAMPRMPKVSSLLFDIEMGEEHPRSQDEVCADEVVRAVMLLSSSDVLPQVAEAVHGALGRCGGGAAAAADPIALAAALGERGLHVSVHQCQGGGRGTGCLHNLRHSFLRGGSPGGTHFLIDPCFRDQFAIPKATHRYQSLLAAVPPVFVGPEERLRQLVELLCQEMRLAFKAQGSLLPPWRQADSMLSKWGLSARGSLEVHPPQLRQQQWQLASQQAQTTAPSGRAPSAAGSSPGSRQAEDGEGVLHAELRSNSEGPALSAMPAAGGGSGSPRTGGGARIVAEPQVRVVGGNFITVPTSVA